MTLKYGPNLGALIAGAVSEEHYQALLSQWRALDGLVQPAVSSRVPALPTTDMLEGDRYLLTSGSNANRIARYREANTETGLSAGWEYFTPREGWYVWSVADKKGYRFSNGAWSEELPKLTDFGRSLLVTADAGAARTTLGARGPGGVQIITANSTWTTPDDCRGWRVLLLGAGAGGAGALSSNAGGGGGGGGWCVKTNTKPKVGEVIQVTIGRGGAKGIKAQGDGGRGENGGTTSFGAYCSATGGTSNGYGQPGAAGIGTGGDFNSGTGNGSIGGVRGTDTTRYIGGNGGGPNGGIGIYASDAPGGQSPGSGGAGGGIGPETASDGSTGARNGGPGADGIAIVEWW